MSAAADQAPTGPELRLGLVGCGRLAELGYAPAAALTRGVRLAAAADPMQGRRDRLAAAVPGLRTFSDTEQLLAGVEIDAAIVACPVSAHVDAATLLARAGLPVLVEKPPAADAEGARELAALEPAPWIGFNRRFTLGRGLAALAPRVDGPLHIEASISYRRSSWAPVGELGDAWLDLGPHLLDLVLFAGAGAGLEVTSASLAETSAAVELAGEVASVRIRCRTDRPHRERLRVRSADDALLADRSKGGIGRGLRDRLRRHPHPLVLSLSLQLAALREAVATAGEQGQAPATAAEGLAVMELHDRVRAAAAPSPREAAVLR